MFEEELKERIYIKDMNALDDLENNEESTIF